MIKDIFPIKIYETVYDNYQQVKSNLVNQLLPFFTDTVRQQHSLFLKGYSTSNTVKDLHKRIDAPEVLNFIDFHLNTYWIESGFSTLLKPYILHSWANLVPPGGSLHLHNHNPNVLAGSFYVSATESTGSLQLENPLSQLLGRLPWDRKDVRPMLFEEEITVCDGKLVLFPGWMNHRTLQNNDSVDRIILGFNFACHGERMQYNEVY